MSVINTNITSMIGQSNLSKSQNALQTSMERLSSGLRINRISDETDFNGLRVQVGANDGQINAQTLGLDGFNVAASVNDLTAAGGTETGVGSGLYNVTTTHAAATFDDILSQMDTGNTVAVNADTAADVTALCRY